MKKVNFWAVLTMVMVMAMGLASCQKDNEWMKNLTESEVTPSVVTDTVVNLDTVYIPQIDTVEIDTSTPGQTRIIRHLHLTYSQWSVSGNTATCTATHKFETIIIPDGGSAYVADSVVFTEVGVMTWNFPTYDHNVDGSYVADENGCPALGATCTFSWTYNVPEAYAPFFTGDCEMWPTQTLVNGEIATVVTKHGTTTLPAPFTITVNVPTDSTVVSRSVAWRHKRDCGQWMGNGATRTMTIHCCCVETTLWSTGSVTKDSVLVAGHGSMTWQFQPSYSGSQDGTYNATATGCPALGATCNTTWTYEQAHIQGRTYTHPGDCSLQPYQVSVSGSSATVRTSTPLREAVYSLTIVTPPTTDTVHIFNGHIKYVARHYSAVEYFCPASGDGWYWLVIDDNNNWYISPDASTVSGLSFTQYGTITASDYAHIVSESNFTAAEKSGNRCCAALCRNSSAGTNAHVISTVKYDPNNGNPQLKYRNMSGSLIGVCSAATGTIAQQSVPEPVGDGAVKTSNAVLAVSLGGMLFD